MTIGTYVNDRDASTSYRENRADSLLSACTIISVETVRDRIAWIIANRRIPETGEAWDAQNLSVAAGLAPAHIGMVLRKTIGEPRRPTLAKIAKAAGVSFSWLMTGEGVPVASAPLVPDEPPPPTAPDDHVQLAPAEGSPLERALGEAFDPKRHTVTDLRAAWVARRSVIVRLGGERWAYAPDGAALPPAGAWERDLVAIVRRTERPHRTLLGDEAWPVGFREHLGVVIVPRG